MLSQTMAIEYHSSVVLVKTVKGDYSNKEVLH